MVEVVGAKGAARRWADQRRRVADTIVGVLVEEGVRVVFGLPGGPISPVNDALLDCPEITSITTKHENHAVFAACGYAHSTGRVGVAIVTSGPGVLNSLTGLASARCDGLPIVVLVGEVPRQLHGRGALQDGSAHHLNVLGATASLAKMSLEVTDGESAPALLKRAIATALSGRRGPVVLTLPMDILRKEICPPTFAIDAATTFRIDEQILARAAQALEKSSRLLVFAGNGMRGPRASSLLVRFAEHMQCAVMTTPKGKGVFPETHPLSLGVFGMGGHPSARRYVEEGFDTILAVGTSLGDLATDSWSKALNPTRAFIHFDIDAALVRRNYPAQLSIAAPAEDALEGLMQRLPRRTEPKTFGLVELVDPAGLAGAKNGLVHPSRALWELGQALPRDAIYTVDSGEHFFFATQHLRISRPDCYMVMTGLGSMGSGICSALGLQFANPERQVVCVCGDGGFAMSGSEVSTAAGNGLGIVYAVLNDHRLGMVEVGHLRLYGRAPRFSTSPVNVAAVAEGFGAEAEVINGSEQILGLGDRLARRGKRPLVLDIRIDPDVRLDKGERFESKQYTEN